MAENDGAKSSYLPFVGSLIVAAIAGFVAFKAATVQSAGAIQAAIETASASNLTGYTIEKGIWIIGKGDKSIVYCEISPEESKKEVPKRKISCTEKQYVFTY